MKNYKKITIDGYEKTLDSYVKKMDSLEKYDEPEKFLSYFGKVPLILDLGCGPGKDAAIFIKNEARVIGVDLSKKMIEIAKKRVKGADFKVMDITSLSFKNNYFNGIWARASLLHLKKREIPKAIKEAYRVLKKDGIIYAGVKKGTGEGFVADKRYNDVEKFYSFFSKKEIEKMLEKEGFKIIESYINRHDKKHDTNLWINVFCRK